MPLALRPKVIKDQADHLLSMIKPKVSLRFAQAELLIAIVCFSLVIAIEHYTSGLRAISMTLFIAFAITVCHAFGSFGFSGVFYHLKFDRDKVNELFHFSFARTLISFFLIKELVGLDDRSG